MTAVGKVKGEFQTGDLLPSAVITWVMLAAA